MPATNPQPQPAIITVDTVDKVVGRQVILESVSFSITSGELVALIGPNGAGKSTLINIILGLDTHFTGTVSVRAGERVQYIPQLNMHDNYQLPLSVQEYLAIGTTPLYRRLRSAVDFGAALAHVGVNPSMLNQSWHGASGGERQRIAIARALLFEPTVLILDEPLAAVDYASRQDLYELIRHLQQDHGITMLLVSHDTDSIIPLSDRVLCLNRTLHTDCHPYRESSSPEGVRDTPTTIAHHC